MKNLTNFIIEDMETGEKQSVGSMSKMTISDVIKAIETYDKIRLFRNSPRRARHAKDQESLSISFQLGTISRSTYYRRLKELGLEPSPPRKKY